MTPDTDTARAALREVVQNALRQASALREALAAERTALVARDTATLADVVARKKDILAALEGLEMRRRELLGAAGYAADAFPYDGDAQGDDAADDLAGDRRALHDALEACARMNRVNGRLIELSRHTVGFTLEILRGATPEGRLYGPLGHRIASSATRSLTRA